MVQAGGLVGRIACLYRVHYIHLWLIPDVAARVGLASS